MRIKLKKDKDSVDDPRFKKSGFKKCLQCGRCTASCPAAFVYDDFRSREMMRLFIFGMAHSGQMGELIWKCNQCYSCRARCPRNCNLPLGIQALRAESIAKGTAPEDVAGISRTLKANMFSTGQAFLPATVDRYLPTAFGAGVHERCLENGVIRARLGYGAGEARPVPVPEKSLDEIRAIMRLTGYEEDMCEQKCGEEDS